MVRAPRAAEDRVRLEGFHAVKHARRFGAELTDLVTTDLPTALALRDDLAPDLDLSDATQVDEGTWDRLVGRELPSPLFATCPRPSTSLDDALARPGPAVLLDDPRHLGNLGAVVRVAAARGAACVLTTGDADPWHPTAVRAAAGLHLALPVLHVGRDEAVAAARTAGRAVVVLDDAGTSLLDQPPRCDVVLVVGSERRGVSPLLRSAADRTVGIPMAAGVSSLNLATAAAVALYAIRD